MTDKEKLLDIRNQINEHFSQDEPDPTPDAEYTISRNPDFEYIHNATFQAGSKINVNFHVKKNGKPADNVDVIIESPKGRHHKTTNEYGSVGEGKIPVPFTAKAYLEDNPDVSTEFVVNATGTAPQPEPKPDPKPDNNDVSEPISGSGVEILLFAVGAGVTYPKPIDVRINGEWYNISNRSENDPAWDVRLQGARGQVIRLNEPLYDLYFKEPVPENFTVKLQGKHPNTDLRNLRIDAPKGHRQHWSSGYNGIGGMWTPHSFNITQPHQDGFMFPHWTSDDILTPVWSSTGKLVVRFGV